MSAKDPTFLGLVASVAGPTVTVSLAESLSSGIAIIKGHMYKVAQVGSFVRIPQGYQDLFGIVSEVGASPESQGGGATSNGASRWMKVELAGEALGESFERGLSQLPSINDAVHIVTEGDLRRIYGLEGIDQVAIGTLSSSESITVRLSLDALVTRHSAVLGSTGSGKSTTVASLLRSIVRPGDSSGAPAARVLLLDLHGEYTHALADFARVFSATPQPGEQPLFVPYWALQAKDLLDFVAGSLSENQEIAFTDKIQEMKTAAAAQADFPGLDPQSLTVDSPVPFSLKQCWHDLIDFETRTLTGPQRDQPALEDGGDPERLVAPRYATAALGAAGPFLNQQAKGIRRQLNLVRSRLLDHRFDFILHPGPWEPALDGSVEQDLDTLLEAWVGHEKPVTILDLSGVPSSVLTTLIGAILRIVYEALYWSREKTEGGVQRPLLVVMEEAHRYLSGASEDGNAADIAKRIAKEGRKYGIGAMVVSQRPAEVDETILSQCGTIVALRLSNPADRARVKGALPDNLGGLVDLLPVLRTGEAIVAGEAARLPVRCRVTLPSPEQRPKSSDPQVAKAWATTRIAEGYDRVLAAWRAQRTMAVAHDIAIQRTEIEDNFEPKEGEKMIRRDYVASSTIVSIGYDDQAQTLEVEFKAGSIYQYFNVSQPVYEQLMASASKGQFLHYNVKNQYPYSRVG